QSGVRVRLDVHELRRVLHREALTAITTGETVLAEAALLRVSYLEGQHAARLAARAPAGSPADPPENALQALQFAAPARRQALAEAIQQWRRDLQVRLDDSERVELILRLASEFPQQGATPGETARAMRAV